MEIGLEEQWSRLCSRYIGDSLLITEYWTEIEGNYQSENRHYHNLHHIENLVQQLHNVRTVTQNEDALLFAAFYHDIVYDTTRNDNEEKSADFARRTLHKLNVPEDTINTCIACILATRSHSLSEDTDCNLFTDADLSILGAPWKHYEQYARQIRQEYIAIPEETYRSGRKAVMEKFAIMPAIFKTPYFYEKLEKQARENINKEIGTLALSEYRK